jgi:hypothetical protein
MSKLQSKHTYSGKIYQAKFIFSSGMKMNGAKEATAHTLFGYISEQDIRKNGVKKAIANYAEKNNIPKGYYCHIEFDKK